MIERKRNVVTDNVNGIAFLMKNKIDVHTGLGTFIDKNTIKVTNKEGKETQIETDKVICNWFQTSFSSIYQSG